MPDDVRYGSEQSLATGKTRIFAEFDTHTIQRVGARFAVAVLDQVSQRTAEALAKEVVVTHREEILKEITASKVADVIVQQFALAVLAKFTREDK